MSHLEVALAARAFRDGRALRRAALRHRLLAQRPIALVLFQLGAEPFSASALGLGRAREDLAIVVAGEPRNRDLAFAALRRFANWFNPTFEAFANNREAVSRHGREQSLALDAPQVLVANSATVQLLGRLGRRLAYLPTTGHHPADPALVRLGRHLQFLRRHFDMPGQQLLVAMTDLLNEHWVTPLSGIERQSLSALSAYIAPPPGMDGYEAVSAAEAIAIGPVPAGADDARLQPLIEHLNALRQDRTDPPLVEPLLAPIYDHYRPLVGQTWQLLWTCRDREAAFSPAPSVSRRWDEDRREYTRHIDWCSEAGLYGTRQTPRQAAMLMRRLEDAQALLAAEKACDDPVLIIEDLLARKAVAGTVTEVDETYTEIAKGRSLRRPLITLISEDPCEISPGKELWWTRFSAGPCYTVLDSTPTPEGGSRLRLRLNARSLSRLPQVGEQASFSSRTTGRRWFSRLPANTPWTHLPGAGEPADQIET